MTQEANHCPGCWRKLPVMEAGLRPNFCPHCQFPMKRVGGVYQLESRLGAGAFGTVYRCRHAERDTHHAVKIMRWDVVEDLAPLHWDHAQKRQKQAEFEQRFQREVQLTRALAEESWHIVRLDDAGSDPVHGLFYVMELLEGTSLTTFLSQWPSVARRLAFSIMEQICQGVSVAHKMGVIHRDLKPENLMLLRQEQAGRYVKILDFGIAKVLGHRGLKLTSRPVGTPLYMAPEQCSNHDIDQRADIYALGCLFYHTITGVPPFDEDLDIPQLMLQHIQSRPRSLRERCPQLAIPEGLDRAEMRALEKSPEDRYATVDEFWAALRPYAHVDVTSSQDIEATGPYHSEPNFVSSSWHKGPLTHPPTHPTSWDDPHSQRDPHDPSERRFSISTTFRPKDTAEMIREFESHRPNLGLLGAVFVLLFVAGFWGVMWWNRSISSQPSCSGLPASTSVVTQSSTKTKTPISPPPTSSTSSPSTALPPLPSIAPQNTVPTPTSGSQISSIGGQQEKAGSTSPVRLSRLEKFLRQAVQERHRPGQSPKASALQVARLSPKKVEEPRGRPQPRSRTNWVSPTVIAPVSWTGGSGWPGAQQMRISAGRFSHPLQNSASAGILMSQERQVVLSHGFWIWRTEVTQGQFRAVMGYNPASFPQCGANCPVENVSWHEAVAFANLLSQAQGLPTCFECTGQGKQAWCMVKKEYWGRQYYRCKGWRLPSEAEWEHAYRAGSSAPYFTGQCVSSQHANFNGQQTVLDCPAGPFRKRTLPVASFVPNAWGIYDMAGNVWEWVYDSYGSGLPVGTNPIRIGSSQRVVRGGGWYSSGKELQATARDSYGAEKRGVILGFRPVRTR